MKRSILWFAACAALPFVAVAGYATDANAQVNPPSEWVASYEPVYFNGFPHYLYRDHWYYRDHGAWRGYDHEPPFLHDRRAEWVRHWHRWR
jgi:hypothetical protein